MIIRITVASNSFEKVKTCIYLGSIFKNQNSTYEEIRVKCRLKAEYSCYYSVKTLLSSRLVSKNFKTKIYKTITYSYIRLNTLNSRYNGTWFENICVSTYIEYMYFYFIIVGKILLNLEINKQKIVCIFTQLEFNFSFVCKNCELRKYLIVYVYKGFNFIFGISDESMTFC